MKKVLKNIKKNLQRNSRVGGMNVHEVLGC